MRTYTEAPATEPLLFQDVSRRFGAVTALSGVSLRLEAEEIVAVVGPSGCGKSTLLELVAGLQEPDEGEIQVLGAAGAAERRRACAYMPQRDLLLPWRDALSNAALARECEGDPRAAARRRARPLFERFGLSEFEGARPGALSGGMRQRVAFMRTLLTGRPVLLLDEPFGALDAKVRRELRRWLREIHDRTGHTTIFVTHDQEEAMELADRVVVMSQGRIEQIGTADEVYDAPASPFVFSFIGESSALPVTVQSGRVLLADRALDIGAASAADGPAMLHFRPHDATIGKPGDPAIEGVVTAVRRHGAMRRLELAIGADVRVEIDAQPDFYVQPAGSIAFMPTKWQLYPAA